jgi:antitoxin component YwqK of YwqJK toxin-antitoxin module
MAKRPEPEPATAHYANGTVKFAGSHLDGEMHGPWAFYRADGSLMRAGAFDRGRQIGVWRTFDRSGQVVKETDFGGGGSARTADR